MKRDVVAPVRKAKIPIPAAPMNRDLRQATAYFAIFAEILLMVGMLRSKFWNFRVLCFILMIAFLKVYWSIRLFFHFKKGFQPVTYVIQIFSIIHCVLPSIYVGHRFSPVRYQYWRIYYNSSAWFPVSYWNWKKAGWLDDELLTAYLWNISTLSIITSV